jgi:hypothetical protein
MNDSKNITIAMLLISAVVLSVLVAVSVRTPSAEAGNASSRYGDYILCPGARAESADNLYVIDVMKRRLNVYVIDQNRRDVNLQFTVDLANYFGRGGSD